MIDQQQRKRDQDAAILWARNLISRRDWFILDTETTGLPPDARIVQIGVLSPLGGVLLDALVDPEMTIPATATAIHGIENTHVYGALRINSVLSVLNKLCVDREMVVYNLDFDKTVLEQESRRAVRKLNQEWHGWRSTRFSCAMLQYSAFLGQIDSGYQKYKWQKLPGGRAHSAIDDCRATLKTIENMAASVLSTEGETVIDFDSAFAL